MKRFFALLVSSTFVGAGCAFAPAVDQGSTPPAAEPSFALTEMDVHEGDLRGLFVAPVAGSDLPGVVMVHEWWGLNDQIRDVARRLAKEGYAVFAIDLYDGTVTTDPSEAGKLAGVVRGDPSTALEKMRAALDFLTQRPEVADNRLADIGWCFGGGQAALLATSDTRLKATVIYYGTPITDPEKLKKMQHPVFGIWGKEDQSIPEKDARAFEAALNAQGTPTEFHYYDGAGHAFANPTRGDAYRPEATADAWSRTLRFLAQQLKSS